MQDVITLSANDVKTANPEEIASIAEEIVKATSQVNSCNEELIQLRNALTRFSESKDMYDRLSRICRTKMQGVISKL